MLMVATKFTREQRMDLRDERVRLQRKLYALLDIELWEPEKLTEQQKETIKVLQLKIAEIQEAEKELREYDV